MWGSNINGGAYNRGCAVIELLFGPDEQDTTSAHKWRELKNDSSGRETAKLTSIPATNPAEYTQPGERITPKAFCSW